MPKTTTINVQLGMLASLCTADLLGRVRPMVGRRSPLPDASLKPMARLIPVDADTCLLLRR
jgi:hypothetical protein